MLEQKTQHRGRAGIARRGFSLIEIVVVMSVLGILAVVAVPNSCSVLSTRQKVAARMIAKDLGFARQHALATGRTVWVVFSASGDTYSLLEEPAGSTGRGGAVALTDPATGAAFVQRLNVNEFGAVDLTAASIGGGSEVGFDWRGRPKTNDTTFLSSAGTVTISGATISIEPETGLATWQ